MSTPLNLLFFLLISTNLKYIYSEDLDWQNLLEKSANHRKLITFFTNKVSSSCVHSHKQEISCLDIQSYVIMMEQNQQKNSTTKKDLEESCKILSSCIFNDCQIFTCQQVFKAAFSKNHTFTTTEIQQTEEEFTHRLAIKKFYSNLEKKTSSIFSGFITSTKTGIKRIINPYLEDLKGILSILGLGLVIWILIKILLW